MAWTGLMAAPLSDGRLQVWASRDDGSLWTTWKVTVDPDSSWAPWQHEAANPLGVTVGAAAPLLSGALELFVIANARFNPPFQTGPGVETTQKVNDQSTAAWADWTVLVPGQSALGGGPGARSVAAAPLTDGRIQVFIAFRGNDSAQLLTLWRTSNDPDTGWTNPSEFPLPAGQGVNWIATARLSDGRIQLFATADTAVFTCWKASTNANAAWTDWVEFDPLVGDNDRIYAASLGPSDGRPQLWRLDQQGSLWSRWKYSTSANDAWTEWTLFPELNGQMTQFAAGPLKDGRLQLFGADQSGALFSAWKAAPDPNAAWTSWTPFPGP
jgi:hypothetical protein